MNAIGRSSISSVLKVTLDVLWYLTLFIVVVAAGVFAFSVATDGNVRGHLNIPVVLDIHDSIYSITGTDVGVGNARLDDVSAELRFRSPGNQFLAFFALFVSVGITIVLCVIYQLRNIIGTLAAGSPFVPINAYRIRFIGWVIIIGELVGALLELIGQLVVMASFDTTGISFRWAWNISLTTLFWGFVVLAVAEVFRLGVELREDQSLTV